MFRQLTVDFNRGIERSLIRANASRAVAGTELEVGTTVVVGDDDWGVVRAEVVELDHASGSMVLRLMGELVDEHGDRPTRRGSGTWFEFPDGARTTLGQGRCIRLRRGCQPSRWLPAPRRRVVRP